MATTERPSALADPATDRADYCAGASCAQEVARAVSVLAGRWAVPVLEALYFAPGTASRFRELQRRVSGISQKELSRQLTAFVNAGVAQRNQGQAGPRQVAYSVTPRGRQLLAHMDALGQWARAAVGPATLAPLAAADAVRPPPRVSWLSPLAPGLGLPADDTAAE
jgi:DNA-binding HxlR family transcriptional regulator